MRSLAELAIIRDRVLADIAAKPSIRPYLTEMYAEPKEQPGRKPLDEATREQRRQDRNAAKRRQRAEGRNG